MARARHVTRAAATAAALPLVATALTLTTTPQAAAADWSRCLEGSSGTQAAFHRAAEVSGVPEKVLLAVSYLESRWEDHNGQMSTSAGYGPMHLTSSTLGAPGSDATAGKGDRGSTPDQQVGTLAEAAELTGLDTSRLQNDPVANICGGAAVLASYQPDTTAQHPNRWSRAVAEYADGDTAAGRVQFARQVFDVLRSGAARTTSEGDRVALAATPNARLSGTVETEYGKLKPGLGKLDCPKTIVCKKIKAPYEWYGKPSPGAYGNHDLAMREKDLDIEYILIHDTEATWDTTLSLVQDPTYVSWQYSLRSSDGLVAQHVDNRNVAWHAGNWYVNMHSIGLEHEGFAADGTWYTEAMYRTSAELVKYLAAKYDVPLDRGHIIGHDQVPTSDHWDPGPFWDWEHYMNLLGAPVGADGTGERVVTVAPGFEDNPQPLTDCRTSDGEPRECLTTTNFVYLHTAPSSDAPLVGGASYTVSDSRARAVAGHRFVVADRQGDWVQTWWNGEEAWFHNPTGDEAVVPSEGSSVTPAGDAPVTVYARAYPEAAAYAGTAIPYQGQPTLGGITLKPGQSYVVADDSVSTDYYYAKTYDDSLPDDHTVVVGDERFYQIWVGHRFGYVKADQVVLH
jgi:N-acetyl-anhydromuramyl-L-alanine amidase AmpD